MSWGSPRSTYPFPAPGGVSGAKGSAQPGPVPTSGRLPSRTHGWGHRCHWEREVTCWMLRCLPDIRTWGFFLPLRPFEMPSAVGWEGDAWPCLAPGVTPTTNGLLLPGRGGSWGAPRVPPHWGAVLSSLGHPSLARRLASALDGSPRSCVWINGKIWGHSILKTRVKGHRLQHVSRAAATAACSWPGSWPGLQVPGSW